MVSGFMVSGGKDIIIDGSSWSELSSLYVMGLNRCSVVLLTLRKLSMRHIVLTLPHFS